MKKLIVAVALAFATSAVAADPPKAAAPAPAAPAAKPAAPAAPAAKDAAKDAKAAAPAAAPAAPAAPATPAPPPPAPELVSAMKVLDGKWKCEGKVADSPFGKAHPVKATVQQKADLNGYWYVTRYEEKKTKENPNPYAMSSSIGFDPSKKQIVRTDMDNMGMITHLASKGWEGDKLVWTGEVMGPQKMSFKETLTKKSDKEHSTLLEMAGPDGKWTTLIETNCKK